MAGVVREAVSLRLKRRPRHRSPLLRTPRPRQRRLYDDVLELAWRKNAQDTLRRRSSAFMQQRTSRVLRTPLSARLRSAKVSRPVPRHALAVAALWLTACGGAATSGSAPPAAATSPAAAPTVLSSPRTLTSPLSPLGVSQVTGSVGVDVHPIGYTISVDASGLTPGERFPIAPGTGPCQDERVGPADVGTVIADSTGHGTMSADYPQPYSLPPAGRSVWVMDRNGLPLACADLKP